jgi:3-oxoacyl-[acyl-carrier-protein] synthase-3
MESIRILGTGSYVPPKILNNFDLEKMGLDTTGEWIVQRTGIRERRVAEQDVNTSDLSLEASLDALDMAGMTAKDPWRRK